MRLPKLCEPSLCTGCEACRTICPVDAISMQPDHEGFLRPEIDEGECIKCLKCEKACPVLSRFNRSRDWSPMTYAAWHNDDNVRLNSSSGGVFSALAECVIKQDGIVYGACYSEDMQVKHRGIENIDDIDQLRGSKYVQSQTGNVYLEIQQHLKNGRKVLFVGAPCQVAGLRTFLNHNDVNLLTVDFICHGVPSPLVFQKYVRYIENTSHCKISSIDFRNKQKGWQNSLVIAISENKKRIILKGKKNSFYYGFIKGLFLRPSCYQCPFVGLPRYGNITIADFWGIQADSSITKDDIFKGVSLLILNDPQVQSQINKLELNASLVPKELSGAMIKNPHLLTQTLLPLQRNAFFADLSNQPYSCLAKQYLKPPIKRRIISFIRENLPSQVIYFLRNIKK